MKEIRTILTQNEAVTSLLKTGEKSISYLMETQTALVPYITIDANLEDPHNTFSENILEEYTITINIVAEYLYSTTYENGAIDIAKEVRIALTAAKGIFDTEEIKKINFLNQSQQFFPNAAKDKILIEQEYQLFIRKST